MKKVSRQENSYFRFRKLVLAVMVAVYRCVRPLLGPRGVCRFTPSCSAYAEKAIEKYGFCKGGWLAVKRICKCHPGHPGGIDPVP